MRYCFGGLVLPLLNIIVLAFAVFSWGDLVCSGGELILPPPKTLLLLAEVLCKMRSDALGGGLFLLTCGLKVHSVMTVRSFSALIDDSLDARSLIFLFNSS